MMKFCAYLLPCLFIMVSKSNSILGDEGDCYGYTTPDCSLAQVCSDTNCVVPSEQAINDSAAYSHADIGIKLEGYPAGILKFRSQDVACPGPDAEHPRRGVYSQVVSLPEEKCIKSVGNNVPRDYKLIEGGAPTHTVLCYNIKKCALSCEESTDMSAVRTMTKPNSGGVQYIHPIYKCNVENSEHYTTEESELFNYCNEVNGKNCLDTPPSSGP